MKTFFINLLLIGVFSCAFGETLELVAKKAVSLSTIGCHEDEVAIYKLNQTAKKTTLTPNCVIKKCRIDLGRDPVYGKAIPNKIYFISYGQDILIDTFDVVLDRRVLGMRFQKTDKNGELAVKAKEYIRSGQCSEVSWSWRTVHGQYEHQVRLTKEDL